jgi:hypothetical protein
LQALLEVDADLTTDGKRNTLLSSNAVSVDPHAGLEIAYRNVVFLRAGIGNLQQVKDNNDTTNTRSYTMFQPSAGIGFKVYALAVDYAFTSLQTQSNPLYTHVISLRLHINSLKKADKEADKEEKTTTDTP